MKYAACEDCARSVGKVNVVGNILMISLKGYLGVVGGSKALIADAIHSCTDLLATIVMIIGLRISSREADEEYPYGYGKAEYIVAVVIYLFLFVVAAYIIYEGTISILERKWVNPCFFAMWGAVFSIAINELMFRQSVCAGSQINSPSMVAKAWESRSDVYSSVGVLIGIFGAKMGFYFMDPLAAIAVGVIILKICIEMVKEAIVNLLDRAPEEDVQTEARRLLARIVGITDVRNIIAREMGKTLELDVELSVLEHVSVSRAEEIKNQAKKALRKQLGREASVRVRLHPA